MHIFIVSVCFILYVYVWKSWNIYAWAQRSSISMYLSWWYGTLELWAPCQLLSTRYFCRTLGSAAVVLTQSRGRQVGTTQLFLFSLYLGIDARTYIYIHIHVYIMHTYYTMCESTITYIYTHHRISAYSLHIPEHTWTYCLSMFAHMQHSSSSIAT